MFVRIKNWLLQRRVDQMALKRQDWEKAVSSWSLVEGLSDNERKALCDLTFRFLADKSIVGGNHFEITETIALKVATMACLPILNLGLDWYDHWQTLIVYEGDFTPNRPYRSADGVVHDHGLGLSGEAWSQGPVIVSWQAIGESGKHKRHGHASNVVIHEVAHKLDMLREGANGAPPMHPNMHAGEWHDIFSSAWSSLQQDYQHHHTLPLDEYALTDPAEFFAVCSETFFEDPKRLKESLAEVYRLLSQFYRQDPVSYFSVEAEK